MPSLESDSNLCGDLEALRNLNFSPKWATKTYKQPPLKIGKQEPKSKEKSFHFNSKSKISQEKTPHFSYRIDFYPEDIILKPLAQAMRQAAKTYELFELAKLIIEKPDRFIAYITKYKTNQDTYNKTTILPFYICKLDQSIFESESEALNYLLSKYADRFFTQTKIEKAPIEGNFPCINRCGVTQILIAPPNYHRYAELLNNHYHNNIQNLSFDAFKKEIFPDKTPEAKAEWLDQIKIETHYKPTEQTLSSSLIPHDPETTLIGPTEAKKHLLENHFNNTFKKVNTLKVSGKNLNMLQNQVLLEDLNRELSAQRTFPLQTAKHLSIVLDRLNFILYKNPRSNITYVSSVLPKKRNLASSFSQSITNLIDFLDKNPNISISELGLKYLGLDPKVDESHSKPLTDMMRDLRWLIEEGYVIEYSNGTLITASVQ